MKLPSIFRSSKLLRRKYIEIMSILFPSKLRWTKYVVNFSPIIITSKKYVETTWKFAYKIFIVNSVFIYICEQFDNFDFYKGHGPYLQVGKGERGAYGVHSGRVVGGVAQVGYKAHRIGRGSKLWRHNVARTMTKPTNTL